MTDEWDSLSKDRDLDDQTPNDLSLSLRQHQEDQEYDVQSLYKS